MASRPSMARANFKKYTEITNPLAGTSKGKDAASNGNESGGATSRIPGPRQPDDAERDDSDAEQDPFGLGTIMAEKGGDEVAEEDDEEEEDPFGLGAIMSSDTSTTQKAARKEYEKAGGGDHRSGETITGSKRDSPYPSSTKPPPTKTQRTGGYFSEAHQAGSTSQSDQLKQPSRPFLPSKRFEGAKQGYFFQMGQSGLGYYLDKRARAGKRKDGKASRGAPSLGVQGDVPPGVEAVKVDAKSVDFPERKQTRPAVDAAAAVQKLGPLLLKPKKAGKAASLMADLMQAERREKSARVFYRALRPLAEQPASEAALAAGEGGARAFRLLMERKEWVGGVVDGIRTVTWELLFGLRHEVKTDDSFQFARAIKRLRSAIEALGDVTGGGSGSSDGSVLPDGTEGKGTEQSLTLTLERKRAVIEIMKEAFKSYHLAWARSSIEPAFKAAADRRRLFPDGELRDALDGFTDTITKRQRNPGGLMAPPSRTVRAHNSVAHPMLNKRSDVIR